jgi:hypothetical protein
LQDGRAADEIGAGQFAQAEQPLAQRVARGFGAAAWPQQGGQAFARTGAFQRQPGQQQGIRSSQRMVTAADADGGRTGQEQARSVDSHGPQDSGEAQRNRSLRAAWVMAATPGCVIRRSTEMA